MSGANLTGGNLSGANFSRADLTKTILNNIRYSTDRRYGTPTNFNEANLSGADMTDVDLERINFINANFSDVVLASEKYRILKIPTKTSNKRDVFSELSSFKSNVLDKNIVIGLRVKLSGIDLRWADLTGFQVTSDQLNSAIVDETTILPEGLSFDPETGMVVEV